MHAYLLLSELPPRLVVTSGATIRSAGVVRALGALGLDRYIAHEVSLACLRRHYGGTWEALQAVLAEKPGVQVLDHDGASVMRAVHIAHVGPPILHETPRATRH